MGNILFDNSGIFNMAGLFLSCKSRCRANDAALGSGGDWMLDRCALRCNVDTARFGQSGVDWNENFGCARCQLEHILARGKNRICFLAAFLPSLGLALCPSRSACLVLVVILFHLPGTGHLADTSTGYEGNGGMVSFARNIWHFCRDGWIRVAQLDLWK